MANEYENSYKDGFSDSENNDIDVQRYEDDVVYKDGHDTAGQSKK